MADTATAATRPEDTTSVGTRISWGAVLAGVVVALAVYLLLTTLAAAIGFTVNVRDLNPKALLSGALVWAILTMALAMFAGGWTTSQLTAGETKCESMVHGLILWGTVVAAMMWMAASGVGSGFTAMMRVSYAAAETSEGEPAWVAVARRAGVSEEQIAKTRTGLEDPNSEERKTARQGAALVSWGTLLGMLLSMGAAIAGAFAGAGPGRFNLWGGRTLQRKTSTSDRPFASHI
jgi:hypothetical protein